MKTFKNLFRRLEQKSKLDLITELLVVESSTMESLDLFEKVKANFIFEMKKREKQAVYETKIVKSFINKEVETKKIDPNFDKPLSELEVNYEIVVK